MPRNDNDLLVAILATIAIALSPLALLRWRYIWPPAALVALWLSATYL